MARVDFKIVEELQVNRLELCHEINFTLLIFGAMVLIVEVLSPDVSVFVRVARFYALAIVATWSVKRIVWKLPKSSRINTSAPPERPSS